MTWETIMEMGKAAAVQVIVRCPKCGYDETRATPDSAKADLVRLLDELS
jgi:hypothetical protein